MTLIKKHRIGSRFHRIAFEKRGQSSDRLGGTTTLWQQQFTRRAAYIHLRGGESVQAARLEGKHPQIVRILACKQSKKVTTDWRIVDKHSGEIYNIRDITRAEDRRFLEIMCERGVAN